jgi:hypothetical protein
MNRYSRTINQFTLECFYYGIDPAYCISCTLVRAEENELLVGPDPERLEGSDVRKAEDSVGSTAMEATNVEEGGSADRS